MGIFSKWRKNRKLKSTGRNSNSTNIKRLPMGPITIGDFYETLEWVKKYVDGKGYKQYSFTLPLVADSSDVVSLQYTGDLILSNNNLSVDKISTVDDTNKLVSSNGIKTYVDTAVNNEATARANADLRITNETNFKIGQERTAREQADTDLHNNYIVPLEENKQDINAPTLTTTSKEIVGAINELKARLDAMEIKVGGLYASTTNYTPQQLHDTLGYGTWENICDVNNEPNTNNPLGYAYIKAVNSNRQSAIVGAEQLPNVKGSLSIVGGGSCGFYGASDADSAIYEGNRGSRKFYSASGNSDNVCTTINIDLSRNNSTYATGAPVQPVHYQVYVYRRIA